MAVSLSRSSLCSRPSWIDFSLFASCYVFLCLLRTDCCQFHTYICIEGPADMEGAETDKHLTILSPCVPVDLDPHRLLLYVHETKTLVLSVEGSNLRKLLSILDDIVFVPLPAAPSITSAFFKYNTDPNNYDISNDGTNLHVSGLVNGLATVSGPVERCDAVAGSFI